MLSAAVLACSTSGTTQSRPPSAPAKYPSAVIQVNVTIRRCGIAAAPGNFLDASRVLPHLAGSGARAREIQRPRSAPTAIPAIDEWHEWGRPLSPGVFEVGGAPSRSVRSKNPAIS